MPILDIQKRARELGRIRIGQVVPTSNGKTRPEKLDRFRLTSASRPLLEKVAELYGGTVAEWEPQGGGPKAWQVITNSQRLPIMVPPQPISQWYEFWTAGGCKHRCDGHTNVLTDELCDPEDYGHQEAIKRPTTRLNVVLRDVEGIGVWRLETHGFNAAVELPDAAEFLARAGGYVNGWVSLEPRTSKAEVPDRENGGTKIITRHFHVPIIEIDVTPAELMAGQGRVGTPQMEGPVQRQAITAGPAGGEDPYVDMTAQLESATTLAELTDIWGRGVEAGLLGEQSRPTSEREAFVEAFRARARVVKAQEDAASAAPPAAGDTTEDPDVVWQQVLAAAGQQGMSTDEVLADFEKRAGVPASEAGAGEMRAYLQQLQEGAAA